VANPGEKAKAKAKPQLETTILRAPMIVLTTTLMKAPKMKKVTKRAPISLGVDVFLLSTIADSTEHAMPSKFHTQRFRDTV
jgi:hypothetical protein